MRIDHLATQALGLVYLLSFRTGAAQQFNINAQDDIDYRSQDLEHPVEWNHVCPQLKSLYPRKSTALSRMEMYVNSEDFFQSSTERLAGAVRINTTSEDGMQELPGYDPAWAHVSAFSEYLESTFPLTHEKLTLEHINTHGLVFTWQGENQSLKPTLLLAHQDVAPIQPDTDDIWKYSPFSGEFDGTYVWGRGSTSTKSNLIAIMEAVEELLEFGFSPKRTVVLAFGFDQEISGYQGARQIALHLLERYGEDGVALLIDEGPGISRYEDIGSRIALPALAEKGYFTAEILVHMESGHSSAPPEKNSITVMADLANKITSSPYEYLLNEANPSLDAMFCFGQHIDRITTMFREIIKRADRDTKSINMYLGDLAKNLPHLKPLFQTTQSHVMIKGGSKADFIPERTSLLINHRIIPGNTIDDVKHHLEKVVKAFIADFNDREGHNEQKKLKFIYWDQKDMVNSIGLRALPDSSEPSPQTSHSVNGTTPYSVLHGTIRASYQDEFDFIAPILNLGNTDSRHYDNVTKHIFRFSPGQDMADSMDNPLGIHAYGSNEKANMRAHVNGMKWYSMFIRNMDEADMD